MAKTVEELKKELEKTNAMEISQHAEARTFPNR